jgi:hypothetical protein
MNRLWPPIHPHSKLFSCFVYGTKVTCYQDLVGSTGLPEYPWLIRKDCSYQYRYTDRCCHPHNGSPRRLVRDGQPGAGCGEASAIGRGFRPLLYSNCYPSAEGQSGRGD